ncbi:VC0807 family protein [Nonomuraea sediminis]|uniref:VC0807 family protein n=1 Tax=Nonomuraea sediminis TaxID=2835864 RepID=UPI001BDC30CE|nr:VC0807 family protein [Nonomuraea sediminis]
MKKFLPVMLLDIGPAVVAYYLARALGASEYAALLVATGVGGARVVWVALVRRRLDGFAAMTAVFFAVDLVPALLTGDARIVLATKPLSTAVIALVLAGTWLTGRPAAFGLAKRFGAEDEATAARWDVLYQNDAAFRRIYVVMTLTWAAGLLAEVAVRVVLTFVLSVDVMTGLSTVLQIVTLTLLGVWSAWYGRRGELAATS